MGTSLNVGAIGAGNTPARVTLINGGQAANVYWAVGSSATINTGAQMVGTSLPVQEFQSLLLVRPP
jgi:hypothetical protein